MPDTRIEPSIFSGPNELGQALAATIADGIAGAASTGRRYVLGCPGGRSPQPVYRALASIVAKRRIDLCHLVIVMMDEYAVETPDGYRNVDPSQPFSCARFGADQIVGPLGGAGVGTPELWIPDARCPEDHERRIANAGIDLFILASGSGDGHVAFNPPGTAVDARSRVVVLPESTRRDNVRTHPEFGSADGVPRFGVTVGTGTIAEYSASAVMIAHGSEKQLAATRLTRATGYDSAWPATVIHECSNAELYFDRAAAATLDM